MKTWAWQNVNCFSVVSGRGRRCSGFWLLATFSRFRLRRLISTSCFRRYLCTDKESINLNGCCVWGLLFRCAMALLKHDSEPQRGEQYTRTAKYSVGINNSHQIQKQKDEISVLVRNGPNLDIFSDTPKQSCRIFWPISTATQYDRLIGMILSFARMPVSLSVCLSGCLLRAALWLKGYILQQKCPKSE